MAKRVWIGIILIIIGLGFIMQQARMMDFTNILSNWWPVVFILVGITILMNRTYSSTVSGWLFILVGTLLLINQWVDINLASLIFPAILIFIGLLFIFSSKKKDKTYHVDNDFESFSLFSGAEIRSQSENLQGGSVTAIFGGAAIDLRDAIIAPEGAEIEITTIFGGAELKVPEGAIVEIRGLPIFGGWEDKTRSSADGGPIIKINCLSIFGGVEVRD